VVVRTKINHRKNNWDVVYLVYPFASLAPKPDVQEINIELREIEAKLSYAAVKAFPRV
jgi:hypothetical protein